MKTPTTGASTSPSVTVSYNAMARRQRYRRTRVRLHVTPLTKKQQLYKNHMATVHRYFPDPDHPYWVCFDSQTTRSKRMEKNAVAMGLEIVEGEE